MTFQCRPAAHGRGHRQAFFSLFTDFFAIACETRRLVENLALALFVPLVGLPVAVAVFVTPIIVAALMGTATGLVLENSYWSVTA